MPTQRLRRLDGSEQATIGVEIIHVETSVENQLFVEWDVTNLVGLTDVSGDVTVHLTGGGQLASKSWSRDLSGSSDTTQRFGESFSFDRDRDTDVTVVVEVTDPESVSDQWPTTIDVGEPDIQLQDCSLSPPSGSTVPPSSSVEMQATVENVGNEPGSVTINFLANGQVVDSFTEQSIAAGTDVTLIERFTPSEMGFDGTIDTSIELTAPQSIDAS